MCQISFDSDSVLEQQKNLFTDAERKKQLFAATSFCRDMIAIPLSHVIVPCCFKISHDAGTF